MARGCQDCQSVLTQRVNGRPDCANRHRRSGLINTFAKDDARHDERTQMTIQAQVNGRDVQFNSEPDTPLLWAVREELGLTGTKFGCGIAACGACTVHIDGEPVRSCSLPVSQAAGKRITTIEGLKSADGPLHAVQLAWIDVQVPQCGYCQSGMLMAASALLDQTPKPTDADIDAAMTNICRCGTYQRIRLAIKRAAGLPVGLGKKAVT